MSKIILCTALVSLFTFAYRAHADIMWTSSKCAKSVNYQKRWYCLEFDPETYRKVNEQGKLVSALNSHHQIAVETSRITSEELKCVSEAMPQRANQLNCLRDVYYAQRTIREALVRSANLRTAVGDYDVSKENKDSFSLSAKTFETTNELVLKGVDELALKIEGELAQSMKLWVSTQAKNARKSGRNRAFCSTLPGRAEAAKLNLVDLEMARAAGDSFAAKGALVKMQVALSRSQYGYQLCGLAENQPLAELRDLTKIANAKIEGMNLVSNLKIACSNPKVKRWPNLSAACITKLPSDELLATIHNALRSTSANITYEETKQND